MRNSNVRAMLQDPLSQKELANRDRLAPLRLASTTLVPAEMRLRNRLLRVRNPRDLSYDMWCGGAGPVHALPAYVPAQRMFVLSISGSAASVCELLPCPSGPVRAV